MLATLTPGELTLGAIVIASAYFVRGVAGFGSGLVAIPLLAMMVPLTVAVSLVVLLDYLASASHGLKGRERIPRKGALILASNQDIGRFHYSVGATFFTCRRRGRPGSAVLGSPLRWTRRPRRHPVRHRRPLLRDLPEKTWSRQGGVPCNLCDDLFTGRRRAIGRLSRLRILRCDHGHAHWRGDSCNDTWPGRRWSCAYLHEQNKFPKESGGTIDCEWDIFVAQSIIRLGTGMSWN